jgi:hypothetical protein
MDENQHQDNLDQPVTDQLDQDNGDQLDAGAGDQLDQPAGIDGDQGSTPPDVVQDDDDELDQDELAAVTEPNPYSPGFGVTAKFPAGGVQDEEAEPEVQE